MKRVINTWSGGLEIARSVHQAKVGTDLARTSLAFKARQSPETDGSSVGY
jgi:hypothetical protein